MKSEKLEKQTLIYTTHAINDARKRNHRKEDRWQEWDNKVEEFNRSLMKQKIGMLSPASLDTLRAKPKLPSYIPMSIQKRPRRLFQAYLVDGTDTPECQKEESKEVALRILHKYGNLFIADDKFNGKEDDQRVFQIVYNFIDHVDGMYCVYGLEHNTFGSGNAEKFVVNEDLIDMVILAENPNLDIVDKNNNPIDRQKYRKRHLGRDDSDYWKFVMKQYNMFAEKQKLDAQMNVPLSEITKLEMKSITKPVERKVDVIEL